MATVYLAMQESLDRAVALKTLRVELDDFGDPEQTVDDIEELTRTTRFLNEGRIVASLAHPHVVQIFDIGASENVMYISMEYVGGGDLQSRLVEPLPPAMALDILLKIGLALECAHRRGVVHRDVKPGNILFREDGTPLLSDFGIAKQLDQSMELTTTGHVLGSPFYISPEQAEDLDIDGRADLYSLGIIFYQMLVGERPFDGTSAIKVILQHLQAPIPRLPAELSGLQELVDRLLAKRPEDRFETAADMVRYANTLGGCIPPTDSASLESGQAARTTLLPVPSGVPSDVIKSFRSGILEDLASDRLKLPALPEAVLRVRSALEDADSSGASIASLIASDPVLSAQVLRVANSAFYAGQAPVNDIQRAVVRLGSSTIHHVVMMVVVAELYDSRARPVLHKHLLKIWEHATVVAALSEQIAERAPGLARDVALVAGLIHDIGALPILIWAEPIPNVIGSEETLRAITSELHGELGKAILEQWRYPDELVCVPEEHENFARSPEAPDYADVVQVANLISYADTDDPRAALAWWELPSATRLGLDRASGEAFLSVAREKAMELASALSDG